MSITYEKLKAMKNREIILFAEKDTTYIGTITNITPGKSPSIASADFDYEKIFKTETENGTQKNTVKQFEKGFQFHETDKVCSKADASIIGFFAMLFGRVVAEDPKYDISNTVFVTEG